MERKIDRGPGLKGLSGLRTRSSKNPRDGINGKRGEVEKDAGRDEALDCEGGLVLELAHLLLGELRRGESRSSKHGERGSELLLLLLWSVVYILFARARVGGTGDNITGQLL